MGYGKIHRLNEVEYRDMESGLAPGSLYNMGLRLSPMSTRSGTAAEIALLDSERLVFGSSTDVTATWDASNLNFTAATAITGEFRLTNFGMSIGISGTPVNLSTSTTARGFEVFTTSASTNGGTSIRPIFMESTMTGAGGVGGRAEFQLHADAALGAWCNAVKAYTEFGASGSTSGLASALCAEIQLSAGTSTGAYAALEGEIVVPSGASTGQQTAFLYCNATGADASTFDTSGYFLHVGGGITAAAGKFASANYHTLKCYFTDSTTTRYMFLSQIENGVGIGATGSAVSFSQGSPIVALYSTCASTSGSNSVESLYCETTMTGIAGVGGRARFYMTTNVALGGWANALKAHAVFGASGSVTGMASALCAELQLSAGTTGGTYAPLESEIVAGSGCSTGTSTSFLYGNITGAGEATANANAFLFELGVGVTGDAGEMWEAETNSDSMSMTHVIRCKIAGTTYYIPMNTSKAF